MMTSKNVKKKQVESLRHESAKRRNIPTIELQSKAEGAEVINPVKSVAYDRLGLESSAEFLDRDQDVDPQIIWKGAKLRLTKEQINALMHSKAVELGEAQLVWHKKETAKMEVKTPTLYIHEKVHPKALVENLIHESKKLQNEKPQEYNLFSDFNGLDKSQRTEFYKHQQNWQNRMILGDSLQVMASLSKREEFGGGCNAYT